MEPFDDRTPIYRQIAERLRRDIASGALAEGEQVMSTTQFATTHRINPATAAKGLAILAAEGLLEKRRGVGMFVTHGARAVLVADRRERFWDEVLAPVVAEAAALGITREEIAEHLTSTGTQPGEPPTHRPTEGDA
ncbi:DNA-binding transcriptional regulator YhcF, GntR family [Kytococcus aerolatus]|uniref:DNA-binding transcriptional regulator YhcF, GntR family n=1 Tax=Kytococcus aerolatus TaxID=592308 RepID=A0A212TDM0_9MICO|nr:GntR family transcriptional regulator [Kytococcus aerolatus]SNC64167.1 DNA-binding transcriptional regulator YhcF, GntR family [Kytococcus aerolatus]